MKTLAQGTCLAVNGGGFVKYVGSMVLDEYGEELGVDDAAISLRIHCPVFVMLALGLQTDIRAWYPGQYHNDAHNVQDAAMVHKFAYARYDKEIRRGRGVSQDAMQFLPMSVFIEYGAAGSLGMWLQFIMDTTGERNAPNDYRDAIARIVAEVAPNTFAEFKRLREEKERDRTDAAPKLPEAPGP